MENSLRRAFEHNEFLLAYQVKLDLKTGEINGVEALLSWQKAKHPPLRELLRLDSTRGSRGKTESG